MILHLAAVVVYAAGFVALWHYNVGSEYPWWGVAVLLLGGMTVDFLWHSLNHKRLIPTSIYASLPVVLAAALLLGLSRETPITAGVAMLAFWGQAIWDLGWHSRYHHEKLWSADPGVRILGALMLSFAAFLAILQ
jgi:hypothetical protein